MTAAALIRRLSLTRFRSYRAASLELHGRVVVLTGPNGAGKTNLIEAISFLMPGRGLRRAMLGAATFAPASGSESHAAQDLADRGWAVAAEVEGMLGLATLGTGIEAQPGDGPVRSRLCRIDREPVGSAAAFGDHLRVLWLTPAMDPLFMGPAGERRRFLDRLVLAVDAGHAGRVSALDRALRSRNRLLEEPQPDGAWLDAIEHEIAELAVAVAAARAETVHRLQSALARRIDDAFPSPAIALDGWMERLLPDSPAVEIEARYRDILRDNRPRDAAAGRTLDGPHLTDLAVTYAPKAIPAADASTGEQKAALIGLVLAHAELVAAMTGHAPVLLLDEVVAHLDPDRRAALYAALERIGAQVFMTGADPAAFADVGSRAEVFAVGKGQIARAAGA